MAKQRTSVQKRRKELARMEKRFQKKKRREEREQSKEESPECNPEEDPDLVGIVPGPQPVNEFHY
jgi:hypothetical protein